MAAQPFADRGHGGGKQPCSWFDAALLGALDQPQSIVVCVFHLTHQIEITGESSHGATILAFARRPALPPSGQVTPTASSHSNTSIALGGYDVSRLFQARFPIAGTEARRLYFQVCNTPAGPAGGAQGTSSQAGLGHVRSGFSGTNHNKEKKVNSRMVFGAAALAAAALLSAIAAGAQASPAAGSASPAKVGVINIRSAIVATAEGKQASAELQSQFAPRQNEIENLNKQINDLRQRLATCEGKCSQEEIARLTTQGQRLTQQVDRKQTDFQEDVKASQREVIDRIGRKMVDVLDRYARENS